MNDLYRWEGDALTLNVRVQPRASRDEIVGPLGDSLKVRITARRLNMIYIDAPSRLPACILTA